MTQESMFGITRVENSKFTVTVYRWHEHIASLPCKAKKHALALVSFYPLLRDTVASITSKLQECKNTFTATESYSGSSFWWKWHCPCNEAGKTKCCNWDTTESSRSRLVKVSLIFWLGKKKQPKNELQLHFPSTFYPSLCSRCMVLGLLY